MNWFFGNVDELVAVENGECFHETFLWERGKCCLSDLSTHEICLRQRDCGFSLNCLIHVELLAGGSGRFFMNRGQLICSTKTIFPRVPKFSGGIFYLCHRHIWLVGKMVFSEESVPSERLVFV
jgi:hypothetical protein